MKTSEKTYKFKSMNFNKNPRGKRFNKSKVTELKTFISNTVNRTVVM